MLTLLIACVPTRVEIPQEWRNVEAMLAEGTCGRECHVRAVATLERLAARFPSGHPWRRTAEVRAAWLSSLGPSESASVSRSQIGSTSTRYAFLSGEKVGNLRRVDEYTIEWSRAHERVVSRSDVGFRAATLLGDALYAIEGEFAPPQPKCCTIDRATRRVTRRVGETATNLAEWWVDTCHDEDDYEIVVGDEGFAVIHEGWASLYSPDGASFASVQVGHVWSMAHAAGRLATVGDDGAVLLDLATQSELGRRPIYALADPDPERGLVWTWDGAGWPIAAAIPGMATPLPVTELASISGDTLFYARGARLRARDLVVNTDREVDLPGWTGELTRVRALPDGRLVLAAGYGSGETLWVGYPGREPEAFGPEQEVSDQFDGCGAWQEGLVDVEALANTALLELCSRELSQVSYEVGPDGILLQENGREHLLPRAPRGPMSPDGLWSVENLEGRYQLVSSLAGTPVSSPIGGSLVTAGFSSDGQWWYTLDERGLLRKVPLLPESG